MLFLIGLLEGGRIKVKRIWEFKKIVVLFGFFVLGVGFFYKRFVSVVFLWIFVLGIEVG